MADFGWSYPPGCNGTPFDDDEVNEDFITVRELCQHYGIAPLEILLPAIDKYSIEAVDVMIQGTDEWITPENVHRKRCSGHDPISKMRVRGIAWDGSDWEFCEIVDGTEGIIGLNNAIDNFEAALDEYESTKNMY